MNYNATYDKIEAWLDGELTENEALAFETAINNDPELAAEVEHHKLARQAIGRLVQLDLEDHLARWRENLNDLPEPVPEKVAVDGDKKPRKQVRWIFGLALLLIIVAGAIWILRQPGTEDDVIREQSRPQEVKPPKPDVPVAGMPVTPPEQKNPARITRPKILPEQGPAINPELIAMADVQLEGLRQSFDLKYGNTMGDEEEENALFASGLKAFKSEKYDEAIKSLQKIMPDNEYHGAAQELLALAYFNRKNYPAAVRCYETYALKNTTDPEADWRLIQFYLADYKNRKADFWQKMEAILEPGVTHFHKDDVINLKAALKAKGITNE